LLKVALNTINKSINQCIPDENKLGLQTIFVQQSLQLRKYLPCLCQKVPTRILLQYILFSLYFLNCIT
jgi:hypothetical protein